MKSSITKLGLESIFVATEHRWAEAAVKRERFAPSLERMISQDDPVRLFEEILLGLDWSAWEAKYKRSGLGQPAVHPRIVAGAILYGLYRGIRSSRKLEEACCYRFDFMWLTECRRIDHTTFAKFRTRFHEPLKDLFRQIGRTALNLGLVRLCEVAFDGTRVKANNGRSNTRTAKTLEEKLQALEELFEQLTAETQAADERQADRDSPTRLPEELADLEERRRRLTEALAQARQADEARRRQGVDPEKNPAQVPLADLDSRVMPNKEGGYAPNYTPTAITDGHRGFIVDCDVLAQVNEGDALAESVDRLEENFGRKPEKMLADAGNASGQNMAAMEQRGIEFYAPAQSRQPQPGNPARRDDPRQPVPESEWPQLPRNDRGQLDKSCFVYEAQEDQYYCPRGQAMPLAKTKTDRRGGKPVKQRVYRCPTCAGCPLVAACPGAQAQHGRTITRDEYEEVRARTASRMASAPGRELYKQRPRIAETPFGILKSVMGLRQFLLRGLEKVKTEWRWATTAFNIVKLVRETARLRAELAPRVETDGKRA
jgi:transposase